MFDSSKKPRIVQVTTVPISLHFLRRHLRHLTNSGFDVHVISSPGDLMAEVAAEGITVHAVPMTRKISPWRDAVAICRLTSLLKELKPQLVHAYTPKAILLASMSARLAGVPQVAVSVFGLRQINMRGLMRMLMDAATRLPCRLADWVWCDSHSLGKYLVEKGLCKGNKLGVLLAGSVYGVDATQVFSPSRFSEVHRQSLRQEYGIPGDARVIGFVGRIVKDKGISELLAAWTTLRERHPDLHLLIVGPRESMDAVSAAETKLMVSDDRIHAVGMQKNVAQHLAIMDIFVNASYREGFCVANAEAAAMELPVVTTNIPGNFDTVVDGVTGTLVEVQNADALAQAIEAYLCSKAMQRDHGTAGRRRMLESFRPEDYCRALENQYRRMLHLTADPRQTVAVGQEELLDV